MGLLEAFDCESNLLNDYGRAIRAAHKTLVHIDLGGAVHVDAEAAHAIGILNGLNVKRALRIGGDTDGADGDSAIGAGAGYGKIVVKGGREDSNNARVCPRIGIGKRMNIAREGAAI